jgi:hypothetical protein
MSACVDVVLGQFSSSTPRFCGVDLHRQHVGLHASLKTVLVVVRPGRIAIPDFNTISEGTYVITIMFCHNFLNVIGHTRTTCVSECRATHTYTLATVLTPLPQRRVRFPVATLCLCSCVSTAIVVFEIMFYLFTCIYVPPGVVPLPWST